MMHRQRAFTLVELIVAVAVVAIVLALALPSFFDYLLVQRLKSVNSQLVTDLMLARSEAVTRGTLLRVVFDADGSNTCYTLFVNKPSASTGTRCNCKAGPGAACGVDSSEVRTVQVPRSIGINVLVPSGDPAVGFNHVTGGLVGIPTDQGVIPVDFFTVESSISSARLLRTVLGKAGRVTVCSVGASLGAPAC